MMHVLMDRKDHKGVKDIARKLSEDDLKARIKRLRRDVSWPLSARDEAEVYSHIRSLKRNSQMSMMTQI